jgi:ABC-type uncharacterized transport system permease subunit
MTDTLFTIAALVALVPVWLYTLRPDAKRHGLFWALLAVAAAGPLAWAIFETAGGWRTGLSAALWVTIAASMVIFAAAAAISEEAWRLTPLMAPYMMALGLIAAIWQQDPGRPMIGGAPAAWLQAHIMISVAAYAMVTIAAVAALAAFMQEKALKEKKPTRFTRLLPSVAGCESLLVRLLVLSEIVLALDLATGMAIEYREMGRLLVFDHKTTLTITSFLIIGGLLLAHFRSHLRGRQAARMVLLGYLLLTLGYPGVKFVTDVLLS